VTVRYIDTHCHLQFEQYTEDRDEIIALMRDESIVGIVVGTDEESSKEAIALAEKYEHLYATIGIHPSHVDVEFNAELFQQLATHQKVVAIGECGLDYFRKSDDETKQTQKELFRKHLKLAVELDKPLIIHTRNAYQDLIAILKEAKTEHPKLRGVVHFFAGTLEEAEIFFSLGFTISFTAVITFARDYDEIIKAVPLANLLSETDAPYVAPVSRRGQRNDPLAVIEVVAKIAEIKGEDPEIVCQTLLTNAERLFAL
jgi:TatD DNase family protein